jgi:hypothetical protein
MFYVLRRFIASAARRASSATLNRSGLRPFLSTRAACRSFSSTLRGVLGLDVHIIAYLVIELVLTDALVFIALDFRFAPFRLRHVLARNIRQAALHARAIHHFRLVAEFRVKTLETGRQRHATPQQWLRAPVGGAQRRVEMVAIQNERFEIFLTEERARRIALTLRCKSRICFAKSSHIDVKLKIMYSLKTVVCNDTYMKSQMLFSGEKTSSGGLFRSAAADLFATAVCGNFHICAITLWY